MKSHIFSLKHDFNIHHSLQYNITVHTLIQDNNDDSLYQNHKEFPFSFHLTLNSLLTNEGCIYVLK